MKGLYVTSSSAALTGTTYKKVRTLSLKYQGHIIESMEIKISHMPAWVRWWGKVGLLHLHVVHLLFPRGPQLHAQ